MTQVIKPHECLPEFRWFWTGIVEKSDGRQFRVAVLRLPSYRYGYSWVSDRNEWQQLVLIYHGDRLFCFEWWSAPERARSPQPDVQEGEK